MATSATMDGLIQWLEELRYPAVREGDLGKIVQGEFGASLLFLSRHAVGRSTTAHIKRELYRLRADAPEKLSHPRRSDLGLDAWESAAKDAMRLRTEDGRASQDLSATFQSHEAEGLGHSRRLEDVLRRQSLLTAFNSLLKDCRDQETVVNKVTTLLCEWTTDFTVALARADTDEACASMLNRLRDSSGCVSALETSAPASPTSVAQLVTNLATIKAQLSEHVDLHTMIRPPAVDNLNEQLFTLRSHCIDLSRNAPSFTPPPLLQPEVRDERERLLAAISLSRARRSALESETAKHRPEPNVPALEGEDLILAARDTVAKEQDRVRSLLSLRTQVQRQLADLSAQISDNSLDSLLADLQTASRTASAPPETSKAAALARFDSARATAIEEQATQTSLKPDWLDDDLLQDARRALHTVHLLRTQPAAIAPLAPSVVDKRCDMIAEPRFALEALRRKLAHEVDMPPLETADLDEAVRLRHLLTSGKLLPATARGEDGKLLVETWRKSEKEAARERRGGETR